MRATRVPAGLDPLFWRVLLGVLITSIGTGLTLPFLLVYLHEVRDISTSSAAAVIAWIGLTALVSAAPMGALTDKVGPMPVLIGGQAVAGLASVGLAFTTNVPQALVSTGLSSIGWSAAATAESTLISRLAHDAAQEWVFGFQYLVFSAGLGIGALIAGLVVDVTRPGTFQLIFLADAVSYLAYAALMTTMRTAGRASAEDDDAVLASDAAGGGSDGFRTVLRDRAMRWFLVVAIVAFVCGAGQIESGFPAYATQVSLVGPRVLALAYVANTAVIVVGQLIVLPRIVGRSRTRLIAISCVAWATCWALLWVSAAWAGTVTAAALIVVGFVVFSFGEILASPTAPSIVNDLAPDHLRGRYNAAFTLCWSLGALAGPVVTGVLFGLGVPSVWAAVVVGGTLLSGVMVLRLRTLLTPAQDGVAVAAGGDV